MKKQFLITISILFCVFYSNAAILRIGYPGSQITGVDYAYNNIGAAITAASNGDTIHLYQQYWPNSASSTISVNKQLTFIGFGYLLNYNSGLQALTAADANYISTLNFVNGSSGSRIIGAFCYNITVATDNITISRCKIQGGVTINTSSVAVANCTVSQCFFYGSSLSSYNNFPVSNAYITNNIFGYTVSIPSGTGVFSNNIVSGGSVNLQSFIVRNNVFGLGCPSSQTNVFTNNIFNSSSCTNVSGTGNQFGVNMTNVFVNWNGGNIVVDSQLVLKTGSPAIGTGITNSNSATDIGVFGGEPGEHYRLSGIPPIPSIYQLSAPSQVTNTNPYIITISVRGNN